MDTGEGKSSWIQALKRTLQQENASLSACVLTHWHHDHQGGIEHVLDFAPGTKIYKNRPGEGQLDIQDGQLFEVEGTKLQAFYCPGHANDHMAFVLAEEHALFTGDNVLGHGTAVYEDLPVYLRSLEMMQGVFSGRAYPGHGQFIEDGPAKISEYIQHRQQREDQVLQVLRSPKASLEAQNGEAGRWTSMEIVKIIYKDVPENLHLPANGGVLQILSKLEGEDKVSHDDGAWSWKDRAAL